MTKKIDYTDTVAFKSLSIHRKFNLEDLDWSTVPTIKNLDDKIWQQIKKRPVSFHMGTWHLAFKKGEGFFGDIPNNAFLDDMLAEQAFSFEKIVDTRSINANVLSHMTKKELSCGTAHCRAGWAITLGGKKGLELEKDLRDPEMAGVAIYVKNRPNDPIPSFFADNEEAWNDIKKCAANDRRRAAAQVSR